MKEPIAMKAGEYREDEDALFEDVFYEDVTCDVCGWKGTEDQLETDFYESYNSSMPLSTLCPDCGNDTA